MKITLANIRTCLRLEQELGLVRGGVKQITTHADGTVQVEFDKEPTPEQKARLESLLNMRISGEEF